MFSNVDLLLRLATNPNVSVNLLPQIELSIGTLIADEFAARREAKKLRCVFVENEVYYDHRNLILKSLLSNYVGA